MTDRDNEDIHGMKEGEKVVNSDHIIEGLRKEKIITALSNFDEQRLTLALMYAENYLKYGIDITEKIDTATRNVEMIYKAEHQGYCKCLEDMRKKDGEQE